MSKYTVTIEGRNFLGCHAPTEENKKYGFITIVLIEAGDLKEAELSAVDILKADQELQIFSKNTKTDPPILHVEEITEVEEWPQITFPRSGLAWYPEE